MSAERLLSLIGEQKIEWQTSIKERIAIIGIAEMLKPKLTVELGIYKGGATQHLARISDNLLCVDKVRCFDSFPGEAQFFNMSTDDFFSQHPDLQADLIIIDACHNEDQAYRDLKNSINHGKVILVHDTALAFTMRGYRQAIEEEKSKINFVDLELVPYMILEYNPNRMEICGGLGMVVTL